MWFSENAFGDEKRTKIVTLRTRQRQKYDPKLHLPLQSAPLK